MRNPSLTWPHKASPKPGLSVLNFYVMLCFFSFSFFFPPMLFWFSPCWEGIEIVYTLLAQGESQASTTGHYFGFQRIHLPQGAMETCWSEERLTLTTEPPSPHYPHPQHHEPLLPALITVVFYTCLLLDCLLPAGHYSEHFTCATFLFTIIVSILHIRKLRPREVQKLAPGRRAMKWQS